MSAHTPGEWVVGVSYPSKVAVAPSIGCAYGSGPETAANARLMAAAPDLLHAAQAMVLMVDVLAEELGLDLDITTLNFTNDGEPLVEFTAADIVDRARAAITKATS